MDLGLSPRQEMFRDMVRDFAEKEVAPRAAAVDAEARFPAQTIRMMGELGLMGVAIPEEYGGAGGDMICYVIAIEEISRACASTGVIMSINNSMVCDLIHKFGDERQKRRFLIPLARGEQLGCFCLSEPDAGSDSGNLRVTATAEGDHCPGRREGDAGISGAQGGEQAGDPGQQHVPASLRAVPRPPGEPPGRDRRGLQDRDGLPRRRPDRDRRAGGRNRPGGPRGVSSVRPGPRPVWKTHRCLSGYPVPPRGHGDPHRCGPSAHLPGRLSERWRGPMHQGELDGQALCVGGRHVGDHQGHPDLRGIRVYHRLPGRAPLPGREGHRDLRRDFRDSTAGHRRTSPGIAPERIGDVMRIVVCVKQVIDPELPASQFRIDAESKRQRPNGHPLVISPYDENALEVALKLKEKTGDTVAVVSAGEPSAIIALRKGLAMGADEAALISDPALDGSDAFGLAAALARGIQKLGIPDLVLCGCESGDWADRTVGPILAEALNIPCVSFVAQVDGEDGRLRMRRVVEEGYEVWEGALPLLLTILSHESNIPRYPKVKDIMTASRRSIPTWSAADLGVEAGDIGKAAIRTEVQQLTLQSRESRCELMDGEPAQQVTTLITKLRERKAI